MRNPSTSPVDIFSNDFVIVLFLHSSCSSHTSNKKFYQIEECLRFGDGLFTNFFPSNMLLQRVDGTKRPWGLFPIISHPLFAVGVLVGAGQISY